MSDMKKKAKTAPAAKPVMTQEENDLMMNRLMLGFVLAVCAVTAVMTLKNSYNTIQLYEIVGPMLTKICLLRAGEIKPEHKTTQRHEANKNAKA